MLSTDKIKAFDAVFVLLLQRDFLRTPNNDSSFSCHRMETQAVPTNGVLLHCQENCSVASIKKSGMQDAVARRGYPLAHFLPNAVARYPCGTPQQSGFCQEVRNRQDVAGLCHCLRHRFMLGYRECVY